MKQNPAVKSFQIRIDGFHGHLYQPSREVYPGKALLVLGGGGMPYKFTIKEAKAFAEIGIPALAVSYFAVKDAPKTINHVPIEFVEKAAAYLHTTGYEKVIIVGISKGAEFALVAASLIPTINGVIAFAPPSRVYMGVGSGISWVNRSSWTYRGDPLPFAYCKASGLKTFINSICSRELTLRPVYEKANQEAGEDSLIHVERIKGPILLCASTKDSLWPSEEACISILQRLEAYHFPYPAKKLIYPYASHILLPFETGYEKLFRIGRQSPEECRKTIYSLKKEILDWLHEYP